MTDMVEKVVEAIYAAIGETGLDMKELALQDGRIFVNGDFDGLAVARAAIGAMREPDPKTSTAILFAAGKIAQIVGGEIGIRGDAGEFIAAAMVDAALSPPKSSAEHDWGKPAGSEAW